MVKIHTEKLNVLKSVLLKINYKMRHDCYAVVMLANNVNQSRKQPLSAGYFFVVLSKLSARSAQNIFWLIYFRSAVSAGVQWIAVLTLHS